MPEKTQETIEFGDPLQIGLVVKDARRMAELLSSLLGIGPFRFIEWPTNRPDMRSFYRGETGDFHLLEAFADFGNIEIELIEPVSGECGYSEYLEEHGEGLHHMMFEVPDLNEAIAYFKAKGIEVLFGGTGNRPGTTWAHLDTMELLGWTVELRN